MTMAKIVYDTELKAEYTTLFDSCAIKSIKLAEVDGSIAKIIKNQSRYQETADVVNPAIPWFFIAAIHSLETSLRFDAHLHNGDPLTNKTLHVPKNRPANGTPPFTWEVSAADALVYEGCHKKTDWSLPRLLFNMEGYNGWGYRLHHPKVKSPYLWSFSNQYEKGKYVADGKWNKDAVSEQCGGAVLVKRMQEKGLISL